MSQAAAQLKLVLERESVSVAAKFEELGSVRAGTKSGRCLGFEIELSLTSGEPKERLIHLLKSAHRMCFTEHALTNQISIDTKHILNGDELNLS